MQKDEGGGDYLKIQRWEGKKSDAFLQCVKKRSGGLKLEN